MDITSLNTISKCPAILITGNLGRISENFLMITFVEPATFWVGCGDFLSDGLWLFGGPERLFSVLYPILIDFDFQLFTHEFGLLFHLLVDKLTIISRSLNMSSVYENLRRVNQACIDTQPKNMCENGLNQPFLLKATGIIFAVCREVRHLVI
ncbi:Uncharacterised protein [Streptococcus suis]|nr:Uncharacterised protein [Streptococcus suis]